MQYGVVYNVVVSAESTSIFKNRSDKFWRSWSRMPQVRGIRQNAANDFIKRALASADVLSMLEPNSLSRDDRKRPDGVHVLPWANGRCMAWDFTCPNTLAASHLNRAVPAQGPMMLKAVNRSRIPLWQQCTVSCL